MRAAWTFSQIVYHRSPALVAHRYRLVHFRSIVHSPMSEAQPAVKRQRMDSKTIGTHDGTFHCDEALAVFLLRLTETYRTADLKRSRDPAVLDTCNIVVDVGALYDESKQRFDHHQRGFQEIFGHGFTTKLSSAGLIYKHFGKEIIAAQIGVEVDHPKVHVLWLKLYKEFIEAIDAIDNGISQYPSQERPRYSNQTDLSSRVRWLNPPWNEPTSRPIVDSCFANASRLTGEEFLGRLRYYANAWLPARDIVVSALSTRLNEDPSGRIIQFQCFVPWKEHLFELKPSKKLPTIVFPFMSFTLTKPMEAGAFKQSLSLLIALYPARHFQRNGGAFAMTIYPS